MTSATNSSIFFLKLPFPSAINKETAQLKQYLREWAVNSELVGKTALDRWEESRFEQLIGRMFPNSNWEQLARMSGTILWIFFFDDHVLPNARPDTVEYAGTIANQVRAILMSSTGVNRYADPILESLRQIQLQLSEITNQSWWQRFVHDMNAFAQSVYQETVASAEQAPPDLEAYLQHRQFTSGWHVVVDLAELDFAVDLPQNIRDQSARREMCRAAGDVACAINDMLSLEKEVAAGEVHNIVLIFQRIYKITQDHALERAEQWMADRLTDYRTARADFIELCGGSTTVEHNLSNQASRYASALENLMQGTLDWSVGTGRYGNHPVGK